MAVMLSAGWLSAALATVPSISTEIDATVSADLTTVDVQVRARWTSPDREVRVALGADRYRTPKTEDPSLLRQLVPGRFDPGGFSDVVIQIDGRRCAPTFERLDGHERVAVCPKAAPGPVEIRMQARLRVPERYGPFGRRGRSVTLGGGWYPLVVRPDLSVPRGRVSARIRAPVEATVLVGGVLSRGTPGGSDRLVEAEFEQIGQVPLFLRPLNVRTRRGDGDRVRIMFGLDGRSSAREVIATAEDGLKFLEGEGVAVQEPVVMLQASLRHDLVRLTDGVILYSDRAFRLLPIERAFRFHRLPILRELFGHAMLRGRFEIEGDAERVLAADALGSWLLDRYVAARFGRAEDAFDVLNAWSFIPAIDSMLYAPDLPFVSTYFRVVREEDPFRAPLLEPPREQPRGKLLYGKVLDRFGRAATDRAFREALDGRPLLRAIQGLFEDPAAAEAFFTTWLGRHPDVQYVLEQVQQTPDPERCATCVRASVVVARTGDEVAEPVTVAFEPDDGPPILVQAPATTEERRTVTATLASELSSVAVDPDGRVSEAPTALVPNPRYDNRAPPDWKFLINNFALVLAATAGQIDTALDVGFYRPNDVRWRLAGRVSLGPDAYGLSVRGRYGFGGRVTPARLNQWLGLQVSTDVLRPGFANELQGGLALGAVAYYGYDDRQSAWAPEAGSAFRASVSYNRLIDSDLPGALTADSVSLTVKGLKTWSLGVGHTLSARASVGAYVHGRPRSQLLYAIGGRRNVRGYFVDADVGRMRALASAEWVHPLVPDLDLNGFYLAYLTGIDGALFADVAVIGDDLDEIAGGPVLADVGYGLRFYLDWFGVRPGVMSIDVGFPLVPVRGGSALGPPAVYIDYAQSFLVF